ncbi:DUF262 domain-containing protein [Asticcacaulis taihuensis]|uniref:DUF262 domain-containing protein n=1 Tax=Asticcacaulis taihuensis TaxID=260084 RepID=UPI003F7C5C2F
MQISPTALKISQLLGTPNEQYVIPPYQRRYSWRERQIYEFLEDIDLLEDSDVHLLGSIVCLTGRHSANMNHLELVDGQQRLTTICILLECLKQRLIEEKVKDEEQWQSLARLLLARDSKGGTSSKIALNTLDGDEYKSLAASTEIGLDEYQNKYLAGAFMTIRDWLLEKTVEDIFLFAFKLQNQALIVRLDVSDAKDAFKLFETINNRGLRLSPTDIIKNFLLGNAARFGQQHLDSAKNEWAALLSHLDNTDTDAFFRYFLIASTKRRITTNQVIPEFKILFMNEVAEAHQLPDRHLYANEEEIEDDDIGGEADIVDHEIEADAAEQITFAAFLRRIVASAKVFGQLALGILGNKQIDRHLRNLRLIKSAQTYGFLMHLRVAGIDDKLFIQVLKLTESFVLRRHICRERANETETLFAKLCEIDPTNPMPEIRKAYREACPSDEKFAFEFANASYTANIIDRARYCLEQIELRRHGNHAELTVLGAEDVHVEHIIPQKIKTAKAKNTQGDWVSYLGAKADALHPLLVSRIGNLTLFAGELNIGASNNPFAAKKSAYKQSAVLMTRDLAAMSAFRFKQVETRSAQFAELATQYWPRP